MKKNIAIIAFLFSTSIAFAQAKIGFEGGVNSAWTVEHPINYYTSKSSSHPNEHLIGMKLGVALEAKLDNTISFQTGVYFNKLGCRVLTQNYTLNAHYLTIPLHFLIKWKNYNGQGYLLAGPYLAFNMFANEKYTAQTQNGKDSSIKYNLKVGTEINVLDAGLTAGIGFDSRSNYFFRLKYNWGLTSIISYGKENNKCISLGVGYWLKKTKKSTRKNY